MTPAETRKWVLEDHEKLRSLLDSLEELARQVRDGDRNLIGPLRQAAERFLARFIEHTRWEDAHLRPALLDADAWGRERAERLDHDHHEQRELLDFCLARLRDLERPAVLVGRGILDLVRLIRIDMEEEERDLLDERILRDDVVSIDAEAG